MKQETLPTTGYARIAIIIKHIPISRSTIWERVKKGTFPKPVKLGQKITAWKWEDIHAWVETCEKRGDNHEC